MRAILFSTLLAMALAVTACHSTCDLRGPTDMCPLHHAFMRAVVVANPKMTAPPSEEYLQARIAGFVHSYPFYLPDQCSHSVVFICADCVRAEKQWKKAH